MKARVKFFASIAEKAGMKDTEVEFDEPLPVTEVWKLATSMELPERKLLMAVNMEYCEPDHLVGDGDEVGFFPPITGG